MPDIASLLLQLKAQNNALVPARIDENRKQLRDLPDAENLKKERAACNIEIAKLQYDIEHLSKDDVRREKENELAQVRTALASLPSKRRIAELGAAAEWRQEHDRRVEQALAEKDLCREAAHTYAADLRTAESSLSAAVRERDELRARWMELNAAEPPAADICPTCGQALPEEKVRAAREQFNIGKSEKLGSIAHSGAEAAARVEECTAIVERLKQQCEESREQLARAARKLDLIQAEAPPAVRPELRKDLDDEEAALKSREAALQRDLSNNPQTHQAQTQMMQIKLNDLQARSDEIAAQLAQAEHNAALQKRIDELQSEMKSTLCQLEEAEQGLALCQQYFTALAQMLTDRINAHFKTVRFLLFEQQKNGGLREICEASVDGVPYGTLNTAAKMQANLEIAAAFGESAGVTAPLFLDNRESVTQISAPDWMQIIHLKVDEAAAELQMEGV